MLIFMFKMRFFLLNGNFVNDIFKSFKFFLNLGKFYNRNWIFTIFQKFTVENCITVNSIS